MRQSDRKVRDGEGVQFEECSSEECSFESIKSIGSITRDMQWGFQIVGSREKRQEWGEECYATTTWNIVRRCTGFNETPEGSSVQKETGGAHRDKRSQ